MTVSSWDRDRGRPANYDVLELGYNFRFDDIRAALGLAQLAKLEIINHRRAELAAYYDRKFSASSLGLISPFASLPGAKQPSHHIYPIVFPTTQERDDISIHLKRNGIQTSLHYSPVHRFTAFRKISPPTSLPVTEDFASRELTLPLYPSLTEAQVDTIVSCVVHCYGGAERS
jgi:dTDP-4-amino-4,6-dideoxygalactose transaminase